MSRTPKSEAVSEEQLLEMIDFIREYPVLIKSKPTMKESNQWKKKWEELGEILNDTDGPNKTVSAWQKEWNKLRNLTKEKLKNIETAAEVRSPVKFSLTSTEEKVAQLLREDDDSMDTTSIPDDTTTRRVPKRQSSPGPSSHSVKSPSPLKRKRLIAETRDSNEDDGSNEVFLQDISAQIQEQNECLSKIADASVIVERQCKLLVANNVKILELLETKFK